MQNATMTSEQPSPKKAAKHTLDPVARQKRMDAIHQLRDAIRRRDDTREYIELLKDSRLQSLTDFTNDWNYRLKKWKATREGFEHKERWEKWYQELIEQERDLEDEVEQITAEIISIREWLSRPQYPLQTNCDAMPEVIIRTLGQEVDFTDT
jgi:hypothetical protein